MKMLSLKLPPLGGRASRYGYSNARVRAMKGLLLKQAFLDEAIRVGSVEAMAELLQRTGYKSEMAAASVSYKGSMLIEMASSRNFARNVRKLVRITPQSDRKALQALLVRWDLMNLKTLLNARRLGKSYDEIKPYLFEVGGLGEDDFRRILKADGRAVDKEIRSSGLWQWMRKISDNASRDLKGVTGSGKGADLRIESVVDSYIYLIMDNALAEVGGKETADIRKTLRREADAKNVMIIERLKKHNISADRIRKTLIRGGTMNAAMTDKLIEAKDQTAMLAILKQRFPKLDVKGEKGEGRASLTELEVALEKTIAAQKVGAFGRSILSAGVIFGFLLLKEEELNNLRKIAKGKEFRMPEADVRAMLVVV
jgi:V/A-type H+/Na+-transporting ATPase subunit C